MRVRLSDADRIALFNELRQRSISIEEIARMTAVSVRSVTDWRRGKYTIPLNSLKLIRQAAGMHSDDPAMLTLDDWWYVKNAGKKGAIMRGAKHGLLGTPESRLRGGRNSYATRRQNAHDIFTRATIRLPVRDEVLAEFVGIMMGDGNITNYQASIALSSLVDVEYSLYVTELVFALFGLRPSVSKKGQSNCIRITISSINLVEFLQNIGLPKGDKLRSNLDIPAWILRDRRYSTACLRGIFDTDGSVFQECHRIKEKSYCYPRLSFVSMSPSLRASLYEVLFDLEFEPKIRNNRSVNLERASDIAAYFKIIGSSNPKHLHRWKTFGRVA